MFASSGARWPRSDEDMRQGLSIVEALAAGCPVVSYDVRYGPGDALRRGGGLLVPAGDERMLADAIRQVLTDAPLRERLASKEIPIHAAPAVLWNFEKFLVGRDGKVIARFAPDVAADDARLREAIEAALAA